MSNDHPSLLEFLYLDMAFVHSISAQLFQGNILEKYFREEFGSGKGTTDRFGSSEKKQDEFRAGVSAGVKGEFRGSEENKKHEEKDISEQETQNNSESMKIAINEYEFNRVIDELKNKELIVNHADGKMYDYVEVEGDFNFIDFKDHSNIYDYKKILELIMYREDEGFSSYEKIQDKLKKAKLRVKGNQSQAKKHKADFPDEKSAKEILDVYYNTKIFEAIEGLSTYMEQIFKDHFILISNTNDLIICNKENLKLPSITLTLAGKINCKVFGKIINNNVKKVNVDNFNKIIEEVELEEVISRGADYFIMIYLSFIYGIKENKTYNLIHPMGIQFQR